MITRLRPTHSPEQLAELYAEPYDHTKWDEHVNRVKWTIERLNLFLDSEPSVITAVDLSCGDGHILRELIGPTKKIYGDLVAEPHLDIVGDINETVKSRSGDLLVCSETLEHLDDPMEFLYQAERRFRWICLTTPLGEHDPEKNYEHYWGWDLWDVAIMLNENGWSPKWVDILNQPYYTYQLWIARSEWC